MYQNSCHKGNNSGHPALVRGGVNSQNAPPGSVVESFSI